MTQSPAHTLHAAPAATTKTVSGILVVLFVLCLPVFAMSQTRYRNLDKLPAAKRDSVLKAISKEAIMMYGPGYYREYKITTERTERQDRFSDKFHPVYLVTYYYDPAVEVLYRPYSAEVRVYENSGKVYEITFGNGIGIADLDKPRKAGVVIPEKDQIPYQGRKK